MYKTMDIKRFLLQLLHGLISLTSFFFASLRKFTKCDIFTGISPKSNLNDTFFGGVKRLPVHVGLIFVEDISYTDVANIVIWCIAIGISYITVFDPNGEIKRQCKLLEDVIQERNNEINKKIVCDVQVHKSCIDRSLHVEPSRSGRRVDIVVLCDDDGLGQLVDTTQVLCQSVSRNTQRIDDITPLYVDAVLQERNGFPDPDLVIKFGRVASLLGYLPWQIRLSEIISVPSHHRLRHRDFLHVLHNYGSIQQRFGK